MKNSEEDSETGDETAEEAEDAEDQVPARLPIFRSSSVGCLCPNDNRDEQICDAIPVRETRSINSSLGQLHITPQQNETHLKPRMPPKREAGKCPCGCLASSPSHMQFRTRELPSMALFVAGPEILTFQGTKYSPQDIASVWKKDCRIWLWKNEKPFKMLRRDTIFVRHQPYSVKSFQHGDKSALK